MAFIKVKIKVPTRCSLCFHRIALREGIYWCQIFEKSLGTEGVKPYFACIKARKESQP